MHRVDTKKRRTMALRITAYVVTITLSLLTTVLLLYVSLGYRFDRLSGHVIRSGLLLVDNTPEAGQIYIDNQLKDNAAPGRFVLRAGEYDLKLARSGYRDWSKKVSVSASGVRDVSYPLLIPSKLSAKNIKEVTAPYLLSQSTDKKLLLTHVSGKSTFSLFSLKPESAEETELEIPSSIKKENGNPGVFKVIEWSLNNKHVLLQQTLPSGLSELISYDVTKPAEAVNISSLYASESPTDVHYVGSDTEKIYGTFNGTLKRYSLKTNESEGLLQNVRAYQVYGNDTVLFDRTTENNGSEVGILKDTTTTVVHVNPLNAPVSLLKLADFDEHQYFAVAPLGGSTVTLYRDPLKKPVLTKQLPFTTIAFNGTTAVSFSDSAQFLIAQNGTSFVTYDIDDLKLYRVETTFKLESGTSFSWIDSHHLQAKRDDGIVVLMDYDGTNQQALVSAESAPQLYFASNYETAYKITSKDNSASIQAISLVATTD